MPKTGMATRASLAALLLVIAPVAWADSAEEIARAEAIALVRYHEGFPPELGDQITDAGAERLAERLADPAYAPHHATLIEALAASGRDAAFDALVAFSERETGAAVDPLRYRALLALPIAMGKLARTDDRALAWLLDAAAATDPAPFRAGSQDKSRVGRQLREQALLGLGLSGRAEARRMLRAAASGRSARAARTALELHAAEADAR